MNAVQRYLYYSHTMGRRWAFTTVAGMVWHQMIGATICRPFGHLWRHKMKDDVCHRCQTSRRRR